MLGNIFMLPYSMGSVRQLHSIFLVLIISTVFYLEGDNAIEGETLIICFGLPTCHGACAPTPDVILKLIGVFFISIESAMYI